MFLSVFPMKFEFLPLCQNFALRNDFFRSIWDRFLAFGELYCYFFGNLEIADLKFVHLNTFTEKLSLAKFHTRFGQIQ